MELDSFLHKHTEKEFRSFGVDGYFSLRKQASKERDFETLLDIALYRFLYGSSANVIEELFYLYGKTGYILGFNKFMNEYSWALLSVPYDCMKRAKRLFLIGVKFPTLSEEELSFLESLWCSSSSFEWMDVIMSDSELLPRTLKRFDKSQLKRFYHDWSEDFLLKVYRCFDKNENINHNFFCYDRKTNSIIRKDYEELGAGEFIISDSKVYKEINEYLEKTYGIEVADYFARELMYFEEDIEKFKCSTICSVRPEKVVSVAEKYFDDSEEVRSIKLWYARDYLEKCNTQKIR